MDKKRAILLPKTRQILETAGEQVKLARLRRKLSGEMVAEAQVRKKYSYIY